MSSGFLGGGGVGPTAIRRRTAAWYRAGGAPLPIAVYNAKGAASLAASYVNVVNPGTYDAAPGTAPTFNTATGWTFATASSQYLTTGITPASGWSMLVSFSGGDVTAFRNLIGCRGATDGRFGIANCDPGASGVLYQFGNASAAAAPPLSAGVLALANNQPYRNGIADGGTVGSWSGTAVPIVIGARNWNSTIDSFCSATISHIAIWNTTLTAPQMAAVSAAVAAL